MKKVILSFEDIDAESIPVEIIERRERDEKILNFFENAFHILNNYQNHPRCRCSANHLRASLCAMELALGFNLAAGGDCIAQLARKNNVSRATMTKCVNYFIAQLKLNPLPGQRSDEARENMSAARKKQIGGADIRKCGKLNGKFLQ